MLRCSRVLAVSLTAVAASAAAALSSVVINEIHYDNVGVDVGEAIEFTAQASDHDPVLARLDVTAIPEPTSAMRAAAALLALAALRYTARTAPRPNANFARQGSIW